MKLYGVFDSALNEWTDVRVYKNDTVMKRSFYLQFKDYQFTNTVFVFCIGLFDEIAKDCNPIKVYPYFDNKMSVYAAMNLGKGFLLSDIIKEVDETLKLGSMQIPEADLDSVVGVEVVSEEEKVYDGKFCYAADCVGGNEK